MKKVKLNLDDLRVESFATTPPASSGRGTVFGQATEPQTCGAGATCYQTCTEVGVTCVNPCTGNTCGASCGGTCFEDTCDTCPQVTCPTCGLFCGTAGVTDCPHETPCEDYTQTPSCTDAGCTVCGQIC